MIVSFCGDEFVADLDVVYLEERLKNITEYLIKDGKIVFISDGYSEYGLLCKKVVENLKKKYPHIAYVPAMKHIAPGYKKGDYDVSLRGSVQLQRSTLAKQKCSDYMILKADAIVNYTKTNRKNLMVNGKEVFDIIM